jgi:hypothetical protein
MAIQNQITSIPVPGGDVAFKNYGGSDIGANLGVLIDVSNTGTSQDPPGVVLPTVAPAQMPMAVGVTLDTLKAGGRGRVRVLGGAVCTADGAIAYGQWVEVSNANTKLGRVRLAQGNTPALGICISQTAADGDQLLVLLMLGGAQRQSGSAILAAGSVIVSNVVLTANSIIIVSRKTQGGTVTSTIVYEAPSASRNVGAGTMVLQASVAAGTANAADTSVVDWLIIN